MSKAYNVDYFQDRKLKYEKNHGIFIHEYMFSEFSDRILGQCNIALNDLQRKLDLEIERAKVEERRLDDKIDDETDRAQTAEHRLETKIIDETNRAQTAENELSDKIDAETDRAQTAEHRLETKIIDETNRAQTVENELSDKIDNSSFNFDYIKSHISRGESLVHRCDPTNIKNANDLFVELYSCLVTREGFPLLYTDRVTNKLVSANYTNSLYGAYVNSINAIAMSTGFLFDKLNEIDETIYPYMDRVAETNDLTVNLPSTKSKNLPDSLHETYSAISTTLNQINKNLVDLSNRVSALEPQNTNAKEDNK